MVDKFHYNVLVIQCLNELQFPNRGHNLLEPGQ